MNSRERVFATIQGRTVDRRPFSVMLSMYGARLTGCPLSQYYTDPSAYARGQAAVREIFQPDFLFSPFICVAEGEAFGSKAKYFTDQPPNLMQPAIRSIEEISNLTLPDVDSHPRLVYIREALRLLKASYSEDVTVASILLSPVDLPLMIMGIEGWLETVLFDDDGVKRMLDVTIPFFFKWASALVSEDADFLVMPAAFLNPSIVTQEIVEKFALPVLRKVFSEVLCPIVIHHAGSQFVKFLGTFLGLPNVVGFVLDYRDNFSAARKKIGQNFILMGGLDGPNIGKLSPEELEKRCMTLLENSRDDSRFILGTSGPDIAFDTPPENIHAIRRAVERFDPGRCL